jgi:hypothetical protein
MCVEDYSLFDNIKIMSKFEVRTSFLIQGQKRPSPTLHSKKTGVSVFKECSIYSITRHSPEPFLRAIQTDANSSLGAQVHCLTVLLPSPPKPCSQSPRGHRILFPAHPVHHRSQSRASIGAEFSNITA